MGNNTGFPLIILAILFLITWICRLLADCSCPIVLNKWETIIGFLLIVPNTWETITGFLLIVLALLFLLLLHPLVCSPPVPFLLLLFLLLSQCCMIYKQNPCICPLSRWLFDCLQTTEIIFRVWIAVWSPVRAAAVE